MEVAQGSAEKGAVQRSPNGHGGVPPYPPPTRDRFRRLQPLLDLPGEDAALVVFHGGGKIFGENTIEPGLMELPFAGDPRHGDGEEPQVPGPPGELRPFAPHPHRGVVHERTSPIRTEQQRANFERHALPRDDVLDILQHLAERFRRLPLRAAPFPRGVGPAAPLGRVSGGDEEIPKRAGVGPFRTESQSQRGDLCGMRSGRRESDLSQQPSKP